MLNMIERQNAIEPGVLLISKFVTPWMSVCGRCVRDSRMLHGRKLHDLGKTIKICLLANNKRGALDPPGIARVIAAWAKVVAQILQDRLRWGFPRQLEPLEPAERACQSANQASDRCFRINLLIIRRSTPVKLQNHLKKTRQMPVNQRICSETKLSRTFWRLQLSCRTRIQKLNRAWTRGVTHRHLLEQYDRIEGAGNKTVQLLKSLHNKFWRDSRTWAHRTSWIWRQAENPSKPSRSSSSAKANGLISSSTQICDFVHITHLKNC